MEASQVIQPLAETYNKNRKISDTPSNDSGVADLSAPQSPTLLAIVFTDEGFVPDIPIFEPATLEIDFSQAALSTILEEGSQETEDLPAAEPNTMNDTPQTPATSNNRLEEESFVKRLKAYINKYCAAHKEKQEKEKARLAEPEISFALPPTAIQFWNERNPYVTDDESASYNERVRYESTVDRMTGSMIIYIHELQDCVVDLFADCKEKRAEKEARREFERLKLKRVKASTSSHAE